MTKINSEHLSRQAYIYIRQSTLDQVQHNLESQRRQYGLADRARQLGWASVTVIDDDLRRSGSDVHRAGFERLLAALCEGNVGAVFCIEASRLARNGRDWHTLLEFCRLVNSLIIDEDGIYDPRQPNDRLLLGMKGTLSEMELSTFRQRSQAAIEQKAKRGDLYSTVAIGYLRSLDDRLELDPNQRVRDALKLVFTKLGDLGSVRQVLMWLRSEHIELPAVSYDHAVRTVIWKLPVYNTVLKILTNPVYAGAYSWGRTKTLTRIEKGRKKVARGTRREQEDWDVLIPDHHPGYITWHAYQANQELITQNANMKGAMVRGSVKRGTALLAGLLRCGHCGRKLHVTYCGAEAGVVRYDCRGSLINHGAGRCISFGGLRADQSISREVLARIQPLGIRAALNAIETVATQSVQQIRQKELTLAQAHFEAARARRQYDAVDPENRLVASELEYRWNEALRTQSRIESELTVLRQERPGALSDADQDTILHLSEDLPTVWNHESCLPDMKKRILRTLLNEIVVTLNENIVTMILHWHGGDHTETTFLKNRSGQHRWRTDSDIESLICALARVMSDGAIASLLNRLGKQTAKGNTWTQNRVCVLRNDRGIQVYLEGERQARGEMTLQEAARELGVNEMAVHRMIQRKQIAAKQACAGAPWIILKNDIALIKAQRIQQAIPLTNEPNQLSMQFQ